MEALSEFLSNDLVKELLFKLISGGLASVVVYWFLNTPVGTKIRKWVISWSENLFGIKEGEAGRLLALLFSGLLSFGAFLVAGIPGLAYVEYPTGVVGWLNVLLVLFTIGFTGSQMIHGRRDLGRERNKK
jgi:hypothetical protein